MQVLPFRQRIADLESAVVRQTDDVARPGLIDRGLALRHELRRRREAHGLPVTDMQVGRVAGEASGTNLAERHARTVVGVDVGGYLEDETGELGLLGTHLTLFRHDGTRTGGYLHKAVEQLLHAEVVQCRTEEHRCQLALQVVVHLELGIDTLYQFQVCTQLLCQRSADVLVQLLGMDVHLHLLGHHLFRRLEEVEVLLINVVHTLEALSLVDGPRERTHGDVQLLLQFIEQVKGVLTLPVHLVDEDDDRRVAHAAHLHQLAGLRLHTLGAVDDDDDAVDRRQGAVGVLGKVLVTRRVEDVDFIVMVVKLHHGCRHRDAALLLDVHPVGGGCLLDFV